MRFYNVPVNRSVPTEANRGLTSYTITLLFSSKCAEILLFIPFLVVLECAKSFRSAGFFVTRVFASIIRLVDQASRSNVANKIQLLQLWQIYGRDHHVQPVHFQGSCPSHRDERWAN
jgi:hypothetical protein